MIPPRTNDFWCLLVGTLGFFFLGVILCEELWSDDKIIAHTQMGQLRDVTDSLCDVSWQFLDVTTCS